MLDRSRWGSRSETVTRLARCWGPYVCDPVAVTLFGRFRSTSVHEGANNAVDKYVLCPRSQGQAYQPPNQLVVEDKDLYEDEFFLEGPSHYTSITCW